MAAQKTGGTPGCDLLGRDAKPSRHLFPRQHSLRTQPLETTLQSIFAPHAADHAASKCFAITGHRTARVQDIGEARVRARASYGTIARGRKRHDRYRAVESPRSTVRFAISLTTSHSR